MTQPQQSDSKAMPTQPDLTMALPSTNERTDETNASKTEGDSSRSSTHARFRIEIVVSAEQYDKLVRVARSTGTSVDDVAHRRVVGRYPDGDTEFMRRVREGVDVGMCDSNIAFLEGVTNARVAETRRAMGLPAVPRFPGPQR